MPSLDLGAFRLIGFDARRSCAQSRAALMPPERAAGSLLRPDAAALCSADRSIWPSVFAMANARREPALSFVDQTVLPHQASTRYFAAFDLWDDLAAMHAAHRPPADGDYGVAFALLRLDRYAQAPAEDSWFTAIDAPGVVPATARPDWPFLGHDVVNSGFMSALAGFGPLPDIDARRARWGPEVNALQLLFDREAALAYCSEANRRFSDGPFYVVALFLLWDSVGDVAPHARSLQPVG